MDKSKKTANNTELNINAEEFVPAEIYEEDDDDVMFFTEACLKELSENPGDFNLVVETFIREFREYLKSENDTSKLASAIIELCLRNENCRYMGVKLSNVLKSESDRFVKKLLVKCEDKYNLILVSNPEEHDFQLVYNLALFLGELYVQFEDNHHQRNSLLNEVIVNVATILLDMQDESYMCILVQLMKLVGQSLFLDSNEKLSDLIGKLERSSYSNFYTLRSQEQISSLLNTHENRWYVTDVSGFAHTQEDGCDVVEEAVLYGPDGEVISVEEDCFLNKCFVEEEASLENCENENNLNEK